MNSSKMTCFTLVEYCPMHKMTNTASITAIVFPGAALGLLSKVYATWAGYPIYDESKWEEAAKTARTLIESGKHALLSDYEQLWKNTCNGVWDPTESLIEISFYSLPFRETVILYTVLKMEWS